MQQLRDWIKITPGCELPALNQSVLVYDTETGDIETAWLFRDNQWEWFLNSYCKPTHWCEFPDTPHL